MIAVLGETTGALGAPTGIPVIQVLGTTMIGVLTAVAGGLIGTQATTAAGILTTQVRGVPTTGAVLILAPGEISNLT
jgi:hypothetical protein